MTKSKKVPTQAQKDLVLSVLPTTNQYFLSKRVDHLKDDLARTDPKLSEKQIQATLDVLLEEGKVVKEVRPPCVRYRIPTVTPAPVPAPESPYSSHKAKEKKSPAKKVAPKKSAPKATKPKGTKGKVFKSA